MKTRLPTLATSTSGFLAPLMAPPQLLSGLQPGEILR
jgi:hypothetical protein